VGTVSLSALAVFEVDHEVEAGRLPNRQLARLFAVQNARRVHATHSIRFGDRRPIANQATSLRKLAELIDGGEPVLGR
jgi:hypothetical protein